MTDRPFAARHPRLVLGLAAALTLALLSWAVVVIVHAFPPRTIVMTTGPSGQAEYELGLRYRAILARKGVRLTVAPSAGKIENLHRLEDRTSKYSVGLVAGGLTGGRRPEGVVSLGTIAYDPLWVFCQGIPDGAPFSALAGKRISIGPEGSATRALSLEFARLNGLENSVRADALDPRQAADALLRGEIDCACMLLFPEAPEVRRLLADERVTVMGFPRADAYVALFPFLHKLVLPMGIGNFSANRPSHDVALVADPESLLIREDLHPAIQYLLLEAAHEIHGQPGIFQKAGEYPAPEPVDVPLSDEARTFYKSGGTFLQKHLPFWLWVFTSRLIVALVPILGIVYPLARIVPIAIQFEMDRRFNRFYGELRQFEARMDAPDPPIPELATDWSRFDERIRRMRVPGSSTRALYTLRAHARLVGERLTALESRSRAAH